MRLHCILYRADTGRIVGRWQCLGQCFQCLSPTGYCYSYQALCRSWT